MRSWDVDSFFYHGKKRRKKISLRPVFVCVFLSLSLYLFKNVSSFFFNSTFVTFYCPIIVSCLPVCLIPIHIRSRFHLKLRKNKNLFRFRFVRLFLFGFNVAERAPMGNNIVVKSNLFDIVAWTGKKNVYKGRQRHDLWKMAFLRESLK